MSTRSWIGVKQPDGRVKAVYCQYDSDNNFQCLRKNYDTYDKVIDLINQGDMSCLGLDIEECDFYIRDHKEDPLRNSAASYISIAEFLMTCHEDYTFLFDDDEWRWRKWNNKLTKKV